MDDRVLARMIDHTLLKPDCKEEDIDQLCEEALHYTFASVCVPPYYIRRAHRYLEGSAVRTTTVAGYPLGYSDVAAKVVEIQKAIDLGADEVDAVLNLLAVKKGNWDFVEREVEALNTNTKMKGRTLKLIIETGKLSKEEIAKICVICVAHEVDYLKTSTGFFEPGAQISKVRLMTKHLKDQVQIKASGGIRNRSQAEKFIEAGVQRIGTSAGTKIMGSKS